MFEQLDLTIAFMAGILGSGHCIGMCGSLVSVFFLKFGKSRKPALYLGYHFSRISIYVLFGMLGALIGKVLVMTGIVGKAQGILEIIIGVVIIVLGIELLGLYRLKINVTFLPVSAFRKLFALANKKGPIQGAVIGGVLNGFIPCPLVFAMVIKAVSLEHPLSGALFMLSFGIGTLPSMLLVSVAFARLSIRMRGLLERGAALFIIILGIKTLYEGSVYFNVIKNLSNW